MVFFLPLPHSLPNTGFGFELVATCILSMEPWSLVLEGAEQALFTNYFSVYSNQCVLPDGLIQSSCISLLGLPQQNSTEICFLMVLEAISLRLGVSRIGLPRTIFLACRWPPSYPSSQRSFLCAHTSLASLFSFHKDTIYIRLGPTLTTLFNLNYLFKDLSKYSYVLRYWGLALQHMIWGRGQTQFNP